MSYRSIGYLGAPPGPPAPPAAPTPEPESGDTVSPLKALTTDRGFVRVPTYDVRQYVQTTLIVLAVGFSAGVGLGAVFGNFLGKKSVGEGVGKVFRNPGKRRTSARRRKRGRPGGRPVTESLTVKLPEGYYDVDVERGSVLVDGTRLGSVYDLGTSFRAVPSGGGEVGSFGTLAGAVKHVIRKTEAA